MKTIKPKLSIDQQILKLKEKGVRFEFCTEQEAAAYLRANNNYFKLTSYRKSFPKIQEGPFKGQYENLDFGYLVDLAIIDTRLRIIVMEMALNVEHFAKVNLLGHVSEDSSEDGYSIVEDYVMELSPSQQARLNGKIENHKASEYCGCLIKKYNGQYPIWAFVEILSFGDFLHFYHHCAKKYSTNKRMTENFYLMLAVKSIRNAAAHNNCIINDLLSHLMDIKKLNYGMLRDLSCSKIISKQTRDTQLGKLRLQQLITLFYAHKTIVTSNGVHEHIATNLNEFANRLFKNHDYAACEPLQKSLKFIKDSIDLWYKIV